ncbi:sensor histidine kinase [Streptomyces sp. NPDC091292]|uniref:sensor histidine kinase n=1 Tax=Streptomyces sp. NPDC091292 TaxID=3365991 RepID=UPI003814BBCE
MRPHRAKTTDPSLPTAPKAPEDPKVPKAPETAPATAAPTPPLPLGSEGAWGHPVLGGLLRLGHRLRELDERRPWLLDTAVVLAVVGLSLPDLLSAGANAPYEEAGVRDRLPAALPYLLTAAFVVPLWWRRRAPATVFFVTVAVSLVQMGLGLGNSAVLGSLVALYALARHGSLVLLGWAGSAFVAESLLWAFVRVPADHRVSELISAGVAAVAVVASGLTVRTRRMYLTALEDHARRLDIERDQRARLAAAAERTRVAREMHDIVGHSLSVMVTLADGAATLATRDNEQSAPALRLLGDTGRQAMGELRRVLGILRDDEGAAGPRLSPQPGIGDLDALLARVRAAGLPVTYRTTGALGTLGSGLQLAVYRIVQEALTNTLKHAGTAAGTEVSVTAEAGTVRVRVTDTGTPPGAAAPAMPASAADEPGHGLIGIRQRAALYGGNVTLGPRDDRPGWIVDVQLDATTDASTEASTTEASAGAGTEAPTDPSTDPSTDPAHRTEGRPAP